MPTNLELAKDPSTPAEVLVDIIGDVRREPFFGEDAARPLAARHLNLPAIVVEEIAKNGCKTIKYDAATNPNMSLKAFELFVQDRYLWGNLVVNPATPLDFLVQIVRVEHGDLDPRFSPKANVAGSLRTPISILMELSRSSVRSVKQRLAENPNTPEWVRWQLSLDEEYTVRMCIYGFPGISPQLRMQMVRIEEDPRGIKYMSRSKCTPPLVRMWLMSEYRQTMSLDEFLEAANVG